MQNENDQETIHRKLAQNSVISMTHKCESDLLMETPGLNG